MSFFGSLSEAKSNIASVEVSENTRSTASSPVRDGASGPGGAAAGNKAASGDLTTRRTTLRTRTSSLRRKAGY